MLFRFLRENSCSFPLLSLNNSTPKTFVFSKNAKISVKTSKKGKYEVRLKYNWRKYSAGKIIEVDFKTRNKLAKAGII